MRRLLSLLATLLILAAFAGAATLFATQTFENPGPLPDAQDIVVPRGTTAEIAEALQKAGAIDSPNSFRLAALLTTASGPLHAAEFHFPAHASLQDVLAILRGAKPVQHHITVPEGLTAAQIAQLITATANLAGDTPIPPEGSILPETYAFEHGTTRAALETRMTAAMDQALAREWAARQPDLPLASPQQALTLASIVERETGKPDERAHVAAVFINRLRLGMKLQSDPTTIYGASFGLGLLDRRLTRADLDADTPYNTYKILGLPPTPICSPGLAALHAALHPARSDDLYFVADGSGGHAFARSLQDHQVNVKNWRALESAKP
jgi:UPF0755 protein